MEQKYPDHSPKPAAEKGTRVHDIIEVIIPSAIGRYEQAFEGNPEEPNFWKGLSTKTYPKLFKKYDGEEIVSAQNAVEDILSDRVLGDVNSPNLKGTLDTRMNWWAERFYLLNKDLQLGGSADFSCCYRKGDKQILVIWDYKNGVVPVHAKSMQLAQYGAAANKVLGEEMGVVNPFDEIRCFIFQPNSEDMGTIATRKVYTREELLDLKADMERIATICLGKDPETPPETTAGPHCKFCSAKSNCPSFAAHVNENVVDVFEDWVEEDEKGDLIPVSSTVGDHIMGMSDEQLSKAVANLGYLKEFYESLKEYGKMRYRSGDPIPGTKVVVKRGNRKWDPSIATRTLAKSLKDTHGLKGVTTTKMKGISVLEKQMASLGIDKDTVKEIMDEYVVRDKDSHTLCMEEDHPQRKRLEVIKKDETD